METLVTGQLIIIIKSISAFDLYGHHCAMCWILGVMGIKWNLQEITYCKQQIMKR